MKRAFFASVLIAGACVLPGLGQAENPTAMRIAGNSSSDSKHVDEIESPIFIALPKLMAAQINNNDNPMDVVNPQAVDAYREMFDKHLQARFKARALTRWPFGPQVFCCNNLINFLDDIKGLKVRDFTPAMAAAQIQALGGTSVILQFSEVYPAMQRGVADYGVTSPTSGIAGEWGEEMTHFMPLLVSFG